MRFRHRTKIINFPALRPNWAFMTQDKNKSDFTDYLSGCIGLRKKRKPLQENYETE